MHPVFWEKFTKKNSISLLSAELAQRVVKVTLKTVLLFPVCNGGL